MQTTCLMTDCWDLLLYSLVSLIQVGLWSRWKVHDNLKSIFGIVCLGAKDCIVSFGNS